MLSIYENELKEFTKREESSANFSPFKEELMHWEALSSSEQKALFWLFSEKPIGPERQELLSLPDQKELTKFYQGGEEQNSVFDKFVTQLAESQQLLMENEFIKGVIKGSYQWGIALFNSMMRKEGYRSENLENIVIPLKKCKSLLQEVIPEIEKNLPELKKHSIFVNSDTLSYYAIIINSWEQTKKTYKNIDNFLGKYKGENFENALSLALAAITDSDDDNSNSKQSLDPLGKELAAIGRGIRDITGEVGLFREKAFEDIPAAQQRHLETIQVEKSNCSKAYDTSWHYLQKFYGR